jgi:hypothetical protein
MAIEIKELHVKVHIGGEATAKPEQVAKSNTAQAASINEEAIVAAAVKEVVRIMKEQQER